MFTKRNFFLSFICMMLLTALLPQGNTQASYSFSDESTSLEFKSRTTKIYKNHVVWEASDKNNKKQIFYHNLNTNETIQITNIDSAKQYSNVGVNENGEVIIVWVDKRNYDPLENKWDVYSYNLNKKTEMKLNTEVGQNIEPSTDGNYVAWEYGTDIYYYDLKNKKADKIGEGQNPQVGKNDVVYQTQSSLTLHDFGSNQSRIIYQVPKTEIMTHFKYDGNKVLFLVYDNNNTMEYRLMNSVSEQPISVGDRFQKGSSYGYGLAIGDNYVAWEKIVDKTIQIEGYDIKNNSSYFITNNKTDNVLINFIGDKLVMKGNDNKIVYRNTTYSQAGSPSTGGSAPVTKAPQENSNKKTIGTDGGTFTVKNVTLTISKDTFTKDVEVSLNESSNSNNTNKQLITVNEPWSLSTNLSLTKPAKLTFNLNEKNTQNKEHKLGVYSLNQNKWEYVGGDYDKQNKTITATIEKDGTYAVLLYDKTFNDVNNHWAKEQIETLAAKWLVNGVTDTSFKPNDHLTRAQFIKMLVDVKGIPLVETQKSSFTDVSTDFWGYKWIETAHKEGIASGFDGKFNPNKPLSREEMITMLVRALYDEKATTSASMDILHSYKDNQKISDWAKPYVALAIEKQLIRGANGNVNPINTSTRAEGATVLYQLLENLK